MSGDFLVDCFSDEDILHAAAIVMEKRVRYSPVMDSPKAVRDYFRMKIGAEEREQFAVMFLDTQLKMIETCIMFSGTLTQTAVYPREIVKKALALNAKSVILSHNHPSGSLEVSKSDEFLTKRIKEVLDLVDVSVVDHIIVSVAGSYSFAESGLL